MVDCFELMFFQGKTYVSMETGERILAYLGTLLGILGRILGPVGRLSGTTLVVFHNFGVFLGLLGPCWDNINCGDPKAPLVENPQIGTHPGGEPEIGTHPGGGGHEPQTLVHIWARVQGSQSPPPMVWSVGKYTEIAGNP